LEGFAADLHRAPVRSRVEDSGVAHEGPRLIEWTDHAFVKADVLGVARADVERVVLDGHQRRTRNTGAADWLVSEGRLIVAYNHPHRDDSLTALVVTLWRRP
jgi:hypothetical protein